jgi:aspartate oxidase
MRLGGVIYLHDIAQRRMCGTTCRNLTVFQKLVGEDVLECVVLGTTMWSTVDSALGKDREQQLKSEFWKDMIDAGSQIVSIHSKNDAREIVNIILRRAGIKKSKSEFLMTRKNLVRMRKSIPQTTAAGSALKDSLDKLIKFQKQTRKSGKFTDAEFEQRQQDLKQLLMTATEQRVTLRSRKWRSY